MPSIVGAGSGGIVIGLPACAVRQRGENVLMYATRSTRFCGVSATHGGMLVVTKPRVTVLKRS